ncbi:uncharacterized protein KY384_006229 [Bacidia gigantensis]|uniref:uncharacterized protein n=1 Tax=Bacidia gigantensis TaxID=2732470 RepID=UPI001D0556B3|nr:uncharacterized protein KY384_006229 [Bacidia gigantensis]KAG8529592.1 hypothetical protein KY384_006229 [Bacidia gigantensis]
MDIEWSYSTPVDPVEAHRTGSFTTLPIRVNKYRDIARSSSQILFHDYERIFGLGILDTCHGGSSPNGDFTIFAYAETPSERMPALVRLNDLAFLHDAVLDELDVDDQESQTQDLSATLDVSLECTEKGGPHASSFKKLLSKALLDFMRLDRKAGRHTLEAYRRWLRHSQDINIHSYTDFEDFEKKRLMDAASSGAETMWAFVAFSAGVQISDHERQIALPTLSLLGLAAAFTNDYFSYDREVFLHRTRGAKIMNTVHYFTENEQLSLQDSKLKVHDLVLERERQYFAAKRDLYQRYPDMSYQLRRYIEVCEVGIGGNHYWSSIADRYHRWQDTYSQLEPRDENTPGQQSDGQGSSQLMDQVPIFTDDTPPQDHKVNTASKSVEQGDSIAPHNQATNETLSTSPSDIHITLLSSPTTSKPHSPKLDNSPLEGPANYISSLPSKNVRSSLIDSLNEWLPVSLRSKQLITTIIDLLHNASLILDDIEDGSPLRRGSPAAHSIFGQAQSTNSANFMFVRALQVVQDLNNREKCTSILLEELEQLFVGQSWDLHWRINCICPTEEEYLEMVDKKAGGLFRLIVRLMQSECSDATAAGLDLGLLIATLGQYFQIRDDYMNLTSQAQTKEYLLGLMRESGALDATRVRLREMEGEIDGVIEGLEEKTGVENPMLKLIVEMLRLE